MAYINFNPKDNFNTTLYTGDGNATKSVTGVGFQPDFCWIKKRDVVAQTHTLYDVVRGAGYAINTNEQSAQQYQSTYGYLTSFDSDGYSLAKGTDPSRTNTSGTKYVSWNWKLGGTPVSNTVGSITSSVSANTNTGVSILTYTGNGTDNATIGHGLSRKPKFVMTKNLTTGGYDWLGHGYPTFDSSIFATSYNSLQINQHNGLQSHGSVANTIGDSVITTNDAYFQNNESGATHIMYCFSETKGFSSMHFYRGNGNNSGAFCYTGFKPAFVLIKNMSDNDDGWIIIDSTRSVYNPTYNYLTAQGSSTEGGTDFPIDFYSNGFKIRGSDISYNQSGYAYFYMAFAEEPLVGTNNIPATAR
jgi:hypothetical protein